MRIKQTLASLVIGAAAAAMPAMADTIFYDGFEDDPVGSPPSSWIIANEEPDTSSLVSNEQSYTGQQSLHLHDPWWSPGYAQVRRSIDQDLNRTEVEWYGKKQLEAQKTGFGSINGTDMFGFTGHFTGYDFEGYVGVGWGGDPWHPDEAVKLLDLDDSWFKFRIEADRIAGTVNYRATNMNTGETGELLNQQYSSSAFSYFSLSTLPDFTGDCFIDNVSIVPETSGLVLLAAGAAASALGRRRK
ncbi:MAG: hypothetical protein ABH864_03705 [archaeon]